MPFCQALRQTRHLTMRPVSWTMWLSHQVHNGLQNLLMNEGIRPINNVVDVTNYILLILWSTYACLWLGYLWRTDIRVREARAGEKLVTLDGEERDLDVNWLGHHCRRQASSPCRCHGWSSNRNLWKSSRVVLEAAVFNGKSIRKDQWSPQPSFWVIFSLWKGINVATVNEALDAAASMIAELAGATVRNVSAGELDTSDESFFNSCWC